LIYVAEGHLPSYLALETEDRIEEERRLFYVAATRAKTNLFMLKPHIDRSARSFMDSGGSVFTQVSRFLEEGGLLNRLIEVQGIGQEDSEDLELEDIIGKKEGRNQALFEAMEEYFRDP
ncbi:MAG: 3'-5' exonuclease, partial [Candidatus Omnitrophica bacterium]|nr:3'-5' exonuclease [Candidatus Omnitrophota bacterium]